MILLTNNIIPIRLPSDMKNLSNSSNNAIASEIN
jgi:hypothetical protein